MRMGRTLTVILGAALLASAATPASVGAQNYLSRADALLRQGRIFQAETLYYYAARSEPRNATPRLALGRYLASRGALRVGAVLLEEARLFGGDRRIIAEHLAPVYARLGDYRALSALPNSPLAYPERSRAEWLSERAAETTGPDSVVITLVSGSAAPLGQMRITIGSDTLLATIDVATTGLILDTSWVSRRELKIFRSSATPNARDAAGVALSVGLGGAGGIQVRSGVPVSFAQTGGPRMARIGVDVIEDFAPTWARTGVSGGTLVLRKAGKAPTPSPTSERIPILIRSNDLTLVRSGGEMSSLATQAARGALASRWTLDVRHGEVVVDR
jgi:hypothetical protein